MPWKEHHVAILTGGWDEARVDPGNVERRKILHLLGYELRSQK
jgi:hypothetical protein